MALGAEVTLLGADGPRRIPLQDLYRDDGIQYTKKKPGELLTEVHLPALGSWRASYRKLRRRGSFDFPVLGVGVRVDLEKGVVKDARIRLGGAGSWAIPCTLAEDALKGKTLNRELCDEAGQLAFKPSKPMDNTDFDAGWRKKMVPVFVARALADCMG